MKKQLAAGDSVEEEHLMDKLEHIKKSAVIRRSITINGHKTSVSLENEFWYGLHEIADHEHATIPLLVEQIDRSSDNCNLSSAIRLFVFNHLRRESGTKVHEAVRIGPEKPPRQVQERQ